VRNASIFERGLLTHPRMTPGTHTRHGPVSFRLRNQAANFVLAAFGQAQCPPHAQRPRSANGSFGKALEGTGANPILGAETVLRAVGDKFMHFDVEDGVLPQTQFIAIVEWKPIVRIVRIAMERRRMRRAAADAVIVHERSIEAAKITDVNKWWIDPQGAMPTRYITEFDRSGQNDTTIR